MAIKLDLELVEVNVILNTLGQLPLNQVESIVNKIRQQAVPQVEQAPIEEVKEDEEK
jgi:hypothetical protein